MTRLLVIGMTLMLLAACGRYGPPRRPVQAPPAAAQPAAAEIEVDPGTGAPPEPAEEEESTP